jgi:hypothetical protein
MKYISVSAVLLFGLFLTNCTKEEEKSPVYNLTQEEKDLTSSPWNLNTYTRVTEDIEISSGNITIVRTENLIDSLPGCNKDDLYSFSTNNDPLNGVYTVEKNQNRCDDYNNNFYDEGKWVLSSDRKLLTRTSFYGRGNFTIPVKKLDGNNFVIESRIETSDNGTTKRFVTVTQSFSKDRVFPARTNRDILTDKPWVYSGHTSADPIVYAGSSRSEFYSLDSCRQQDRFVFKFATRQIDLNDGAIACAPPEPGQASIYVKNQSFALGRSATVDSIYVANSTRLTLGTFAVDPLNPTRFPTNYIIEELNENNLRLRYNARVGTVSTTFRLSFTRP